MNIKEEIITAAQSLGTHISELNSQESEQFRLTLFSKFTDVSLDGHIWENILRKYEDHVATYTDANNKTYLLIDDFVKQKEVFMIFDGSEEKTVFKFKDGSEIVSLLSECYDFEFYLTNQKIEYLLCLNNHDYLIAVGTAADWLKSLVDENKELRKSIEEIVLTGKSG